jgi:hypothetical protein
MERVRQVITPQMNPMITAEEISSTVLGMLTGFPK